MIIPIQLQEDCKWAILYEVDKPPKNPNTRIFLGDLEKRIPEFSRNEIEITACWLIQNGYLVGKYRETQGKFDLTYLSDITEKGKEYIG